MVPGLWETHTPTNDPVFSLPACQVWSMRASAVGLYASLVLTAPMLYYRHWPTQRAFTPRCYCRSRARCAHYSSRLGGDEVNLCPCPYLTWQISSGQEGWDASCYSSRSCSKSLTCVMAQDVRFGSAVLNLTVWMDGVSRVGCNFSKQPVALCSMPTYSEGHSCSSGQGRTSRL